MMEHKEALTLDNGDRVVVRTGEVNFTTDIRTIGHSLVADEPLEKGGRDQGPTAYDLLLAALGSCTSITLRMYAAHKQWELGDITVRLEHDKFHAEDCEDVENVTGRIDCIRRDIEVTGNLTEEQKERLLYIADKCPVHKTLKGPLGVRTSLKAAVASESSTTA